MDCKIDATPYYPEVMLDTQSRKLFFNFSEGDRVYHSDYLRFLEPFIDYLQQAMTLEASSFEIYFDKSESQMKTSVYYCTLLTKLQSLPCQELLRFIFKS